MMDEREDLVEDLLTEYAIQLSIQESNGAKAPTSSSYHDSFLPPSEENRKIVTAIKQGQVFGLQELVKQKYALDEADERGWFPLHEAAAQPIQQILEIILDASYKTMWEYKTSDGETPLTLAAKAGFVENVRTLLEKGVWPNTRNDKGETPLLIGGDVQAVADDGSSILFDAAGGGNPDCISLLLEYGGSGNVPNRAGLLPIHKAAFEGHYLALKYLIPVTSQTAIQKSGLSPVHSAAEGQNSQCLELLIENGFDVNTLLAEHMSDSYDDERKTALYFAVSNNDILCTEILLKAGANPNKDPLNCLLVAVRAGNHEIVRLLLSYGANVNCYFMLVNDTHFPSAIQYALNDEVMLRLLLNHGYNVEMCFDCMHQDIFGNSFVWSTPEEDILPGWTSSVIKDNPFCDFIAVPWLKHLAGKVIRVFIDYMDYVPLCTKIKLVLETQKEWTEIRQILDNPRPLKHLCRLKIRKLLGLRRLQNLSSLKKFPLPPVLKNYILYKEYDLYGEGIRLE
ncbi:ankyrin repeat and SOCS box protein 15 isoform X3 [Patagioenas fasciata]|uniref:ankyrin repeat and SOCS box protein 15 isoform X3 n=1 Tax=Patagioenas fasciata TaxID=372321 RepID=UPI003A99303C